MDRYLHQNLPKAREQRKTAAALKASIAAAKSRIAANTEKEVNFREL